VEPDLVAAVLGDLAIIVAAARLVGALFVRLRQPRVVGEMVAGILIGPSVLGAAATEVVFPAGSPAFLQLLGTVALVLFTFLVGLEVPQHLLRGRVVRVGLVGVAVTFAAVGAGFLLAPLLDAPGLWSVPGVPHEAQALLIGAGVSATALPVVARVLQEKGLVATAVGAFGIGGAAVVTPLTFVVLGAAASVATGGDPPVAAGIRLGLLAALVAVLALAVRPLLARLLARRFHGTDLDGGVCALLLAGALLTAAATDRIGVQALPGGLLFGAAVPQLPGLARAVQARLQQVVVVVGIPVFLAVSGLQTDLRTVRPEHAGAVALFLLAVVVAKFGLGAAVGRATGLPVRDAGAIGVLLSCGGLVTLVVALAARLLGLITPSLQVVFVLGAIVTTLATGPALDRFVRPG
jgi:Kef-type K+ transport system membrane component KefB